MYKMAISPLQSSYVTHNVGAKSIILDSARSLYAKEKELNVVMLDLTWVVNGIGFQYLRSFYRGGTTKGAEPFLIDLIIDNSSVEEHIAFFIPGTFSLSQKTGDVFTVSSQIDVLPSVKDSTFENALFMMQQAYGNNISNVINLFNQIVNVNWPEA